MSATATRITNKSDSCSIRIDATRIGSKTTAVRILATEGGTPVKIDLPFGFGDWAFTVRLCVRALSASEVQKPGQRFPYKRVFNLFRIHYKFQAAKPPVPLLIIKYGLQQMHSTEIRPESFGYVNFGIRDLPEKKIRDAQLAAGAN